MDQCCVNIAFEHYGIRFYMEDNFFRFFTITKSISAYCALS